MTDITANILLVLGFVLVGGVFAATEIALVSLRESQVKALASRGRRGEKVAGLAHDPNRFLAAVQIGVTLAGFFSAAFGAATLADDLAPVLEGWGVSHGLSRTLSLVLITLAVSYVSLVLGELVPKRLALQRAEGFSLALAPALDRIATAARPVIWLLSVSTNVLVRLLGGDPHAQREQISDEELRELVTGHETLGEEERQIVEDVFAAGDRMVREVMVPRTEVDFLDASVPVREVARAVAGQPHSRYPVVRGSADDVVGFVHIRDLLDPDVAERSDLRVGDLVREVPMFPGTKRLLPALTEMRRRSTHLAIVVDEYGGTAGIASMEDLVEELLGDIRDEYDDPSAEIAGVEGDTEVEGLLNVDDFAERVGVPLPEGPYETVGGYVQTALGRLPVAGDVIDSGAIRLTVLELDGRRVSRVRVDPVAVPPPPALTE